MINRFFWWCAGANIDILKKCPTDHAKYFGVGGTIVFTALMASFAGGYAFFTAFKAVTPSIFFGAFWGLLIFNLDRYIVSTIGKGDGTQKITKDEWKIAAPRLLMAVLLGFVISTPLELKIFETEIQTVVERLKIDKAEELKNRDTTFIAALNKIKERRTSIESEISKLTYDKTNLANNAGLFFQNSIAELKNDLKNKNSLMETLQKKVNSSYSQYIRAKNDSLKSNVINSRLNTLRARQGERNKARTEIAELQEKITELNENKGNAIIEEKNRINDLLSNKQQEKEALDQQINSKQKTVDLKNEGYEQKTKNYDGFAAHLEAMSILTSWDTEVENWWKVKIPAMWWAKWLITLLFIFIEVAPVLFKLMAEAGPYDDMMDRIKHESFVKEKQRISDINDEINTSIKISTEKNQNKLDAEIAANTALLNKIALAQAEVAELAIEKWKKEELKKLRSGVNNIINGQKKKPTSETKV
ncbi:DUF4407 domain-containing protein [Maribacter dokdonensis]|uniref:DUF4407 domain-containing protein n=1 Tax=Maribacter dokdonensis TaxID=320912 RepID=UPI000719995C|nr:DUF4407 domain-containing protein [Maribacter dokdonensis]KSA13476.1 hypothetical protein I600_66 [Maribacter dokdonensis DSW-8]